MLRFVAVENFNNVIIRGLRRRCPAVDLIRVQDSGLVGADDPAILSWAAALAKEAGGDGEAAGARPEAGAAPA